MLSQTQTFTSIGRQKEDFRRIITLLFSIQWKWMVTRPQARYAPFKHHKHSPWDSCTINYCSKYCSSITVTVWKRTTFSFSVSQKKKRKKITKSKYVFALFHYKVVNPQMRMSRAICHLSLPVLCWQVSGFAIAPMRHWQHTHTTCYTPSRSPNTKRLSVSQWKLTSTKWIRDLGLSYFTNNKSSSPQKRCYSCNLGDGGSDWAQRPSSKSKDMVTPGERVNVGSVRGHSRASRYWRDLNVTKTVDMWLTPPAEKSMWNYHWLGLLW